ncbi:RAxF-45 family protein [Salirhabdus sp. Marseille-P4669]|nr:RAxF-45 family protein [Salirhabdus sp. Marseille-P4669]
MMNTCAHALDTNCLYFYRAITHDFTANGIRMPFFSN